MDSYTRGLVVILAPLLPEAGMTAAERVAYPGTLTEWQRAELSSAEIRGLVDGDLYGTPGAGWVLTVDGARIVRGWLARAQRAA